MVQSVPDLLVRVEQCDRPATADGSLAKTQTITDGVRRRLSLVGIAALATTGPLWGTACRAQYTPGVFHQYIMQRLEGEELELAQDLLQETQHFSYAMIDDLNRDPDKYLGIMNSLDRTDVETIDLVYDGYSATQPYRMAPERMLHLAQTQCAQMINTRELEDETGFNIGIGIDENWTTGDMGTPSHSLDWDLCTDDLCPENWNDEEPITYITAADSSLTNTRYRIPLYIHQGYLDDLSEDRSVERWCSSFSLWYHELCGHGTGFSHDDDIVATYYRESANGNLFLSRDVETVDFAYALQGEARERCEAFYWASEEDTGTEGGAESSEESRTGNDREIEPCAETRTATAERE